MLQGKRFAEMAAPARKQGFRKGASSDNPDRLKNPKDTSLRDRGTINRLNMYRSGKPIRDRKGKILGGSFMSRDRAGDRAITATTGRIQPDRRWFGNTRVIDSHALDDFREAVSKQQADPYAVLVRSKKLPMALVSSAAGRVEGPGGDDETAAAEDAARAAAAYVEPTGPTGALRLDLKAGHRATNRLHTSAAVAAANRGAKSAAAAAARSGGFKHAFGKQGNRKRVNLSTLAAGAGSLAELAASVEAKDKDYVEAGDADRARAEEHGFVDADRVVSAAGIRPVGGTDPEEEDMDNELGGGLGAGLSRRARSEGVREGVFDKGQSKRIWGELFKVLDCSDVVVQVLDARNPMGTRSRKLETHLKREARHKHLILVLNKVDLVPVWVTRRWVALLSKEYPTLAFHASGSVAFGKGALIQLLQQYTRLHADKPQISVGFVGYPNVGKSSVINALKKKVVCKVAPVPGHTKVWQYITLFRKTFLIDCPGVVPHTRDSETDIVLKGVTRAERLPDPETHITEILQRCDPKHLEATYGVSGWTGTVSFLSLVAKKYGKLRRAGEPDTAIVARTVINDWQRGKIPWYTTPPDDGSAFAAEQAEELDEAARAAAAEEDAIVEEAAAEAAARSEAARGGPAPGVLSSSRGTIDAGGAVLGAEAPEQDWGRLRVSTVWKDEDAAHRQAEKDSKSEEQLAAQATADDAAKEARAARRAPKRRRALSRDRDRDSKRTAAAAASSAAEAPVASKTTFNASDFDDLDF